MLYPIGIQDFEKIRKDAFVYVDKSELIYKLFHGSPSYYFLSRPRRFGKSLLVSTMEAYFSGRKELFEGLALEKLEKDWVQYPVLRLDLSGKSYDSADVLRKVFDDILSYWERQYGCEPRSDVPGLRFGHVIEAAYRKTGRQVVILIDEYDKPIVDNLTDDPLMDTFRRQLQGFYSVLKSQDRYIKFGFLTGVTRIGKLSVFSGLNNLTDISMEREYAGICGITEDELKACFQEGVREMAEANQITVDACFTQLEKTYDGYHFHPSAPGVYNPFSLLSALHAKEFKFYWFETGTPSFLVQIMKQSHYDVTRLSDEEMDAPTLMDVDTAFHNPIPLLYQSGYLTIKGYEPEFGLYHLGFPNLEVKHGFLNYLVKFYTPARSESGMMLVSRMLKDIRSGNPEAFLQKLEALFAKTSYQIQGNSEKDFQYAMYLILELMGEYVEVEKATSNGRMDILLQTDKYVYIIEIKINDTVEAALRQIEDKGYARRFADDLRRQFKIGIRFSTDSRCIDAWKIAD